MRYRILENTGISLHKILVKYQKENSECYIEEKEWAVTRLGNES